MKNLSKDHSSSQLSRIETGAIAYANVKQTSTFQVVKWSKLAQMVALVVSVRVIALIRVRKLLVSL